MAREQTMRLWQLNDCRYRKFWDSRREARHDRTGAMLHEITFPLRRIWGTPAQQRATHRLTPPIRSLAALLSAVTKCRRNCR
jgi:hypothetical protein